MPSLGTLTAYLEADTGKFRAEMQRAQGVVHTVRRSIEQHVTGINKSLSGMVAQTFTLRGALATLAGTGGIGLMIQQTVAYADGIQKMADRTGVGVGALQELQHAARQSGLGIETLDQGLGILNRRLGEAASGNKEAAQSFAGIGVSIADAGGRLRSTQDILADIADRVARAGSQAERARIAYEAFGRSGAQWLPMLMQGREGLQRMGDEARRLGLVMDADMIQKAVQARDQLGTLAQIVRVNLTTAFSQFVTSEGFSSFLRNVIELSARARRSVISLFELLPGAGPGDPDILLGQQLAQINHQIDALQQRLQSLRQLQESSPGLAKSIERDERALEQLQMRARVLEAALKTPGQLLTPERPGTAPGAQVVDPSIARREEAIQRVVEALAFEHAQLARTAREQAVYNDLQRAGIDITHEAAAGIMAMRAAIQARQDVMADEAARIAAWNEAWVAAASAEQAYFQGLEGRAAQIRAEILAPQERFMRQLDEIEQLRRLGLLTEQEYMRAVGHTTERYHEQHGAAERLIGAMQTELDLLRLTELERRTAIALRQVEGKATEEQIDRIRALVAEQYNADIRQRLVTEAFARHQQEVAAQMRMVERIGTASIDSIARGFERATLEGGRLSDVLKQLAIDLMRLAARETATRTLSPLIGAGLNAIMRAFGGGISGAQTTGALGMFGGATDMAEGGIVQPRPGGVLARLAEAGQAEAVIPLPNGIDQLLRRGARQSADGTGVMVNQQFNFTLGIAPTVRAEVLRLMPMIVSTTKRSLADARRRGA